jgi:hypothetical protein
MSSNGFLPSTDAGLLAWSENFSALINAAGAPYGVPVPLAVAYATKHTSYATKLQLAVEPTTRTKLTVADKNDAKHFLKVAARQIASIIDGQATVTTAQRLALGLTVRDVVPTPIPAPSAAPLIEVKGVFGRTARVRLIDAAHPTRRGRPAGTIGAAVFSYVGAGPGGATPPADLGLWKFEGNTGRTTVDVLFPNAVAPGATVWLAAFWFNARMQAGPTAAPVSTNLPGGSVTALAA